jgi:hypothetical protein
MNNLNLFRLTFFLTFIYSSVLLYNGCYSRLNYNDNNYEITCLGEGDDGNYIVKVYTYGSNDAVALDQAKYQAIHGVIFKGLREGCGHRNKSPLANCSYESQQEFFENFFSSKEYQSYVVVVSNNYITLDRIRTQNGDKIGYVVSVDIKSLRKYLEQEGIAINT